MEPALEKESWPAGSVRPPCPVFGECGGCFYQNIAYPEELGIKEKQLRDLLRESAGIPENVFSPIVPSPKPYHYRNRLDLKLKRTKDGDILIGFTPADDGRGIVPVEACFTADRNISDFIPALKRQAVERLPAKYRTANLVVRTGDDGRALWGGIGRRSCRLPERDYLWTEIGGKRIFYSLDTFFQANLPVLPKLFDAIRALPCWDPAPVFYDLYGGVGLFGIGLSDKVRKVILVEECASSVRLACYNAVYHRLTNVKIVEGKVEDRLPLLLKEGGSSRGVAMADPPRAGLSDGALRLLAAANAFSHILYLSCNPAALAHDLHGFIDGGWQVEKIIPFDFFPRTKHLEVLALLKGP